MVDGMLFRPADIYSRSDVAQIDVLILFLKPFPRKQKCGAGNVIFILMFFCSASALLQRSRGMSMTFASLPSLLSNLTSLYEAHATRKN